MSDRLFRHSSQLLAGSLCLGLAAANLVRAQSLLAVVVAGLLGGGLTVFRGPRRLGWLAIALALGAWWWGSARLDALDRSPLTARLESAGRVLVTVTGPARRGKYDVRAPAVVTRFAGQALREPVQLKLPLGRAPPQGAVLDALVRVTAPRGPQKGFDERTWLRRHGVHVVLLVDRWRIVGRRGGLGGVADALRRQLQSSVARGLTGYRAAVLEGVVLGEDSGLSDELRRRFRASGLYHLLRVDILSITTTGRSPVGRTVKRKVDGYTRVSRVGGREGDSYRSPTEQRREIEAYARANALEIADWHEDEDQSGGQMSRPAFDRALARCRSGATGGIIAAKQNRIARNTRGWLDLLEKAQGEKWSLIVLDVQLDMTTPNGRFVATILAANAQRELDQHREDLAGHRKRAVERGIHVASRVPTGYRKREDDRRLEPDPRGAKAVRELFRRRAQGGGWTELARFLDTKKISGPYGNNGWTPSAVAKIVRNRVYLGEARSGPHRNPNAHEPIVTVAEWEAAQWKGQTPSTPRSEEGALLTGLVRCAGCRYRVKPDTMRDRDGSHPRNYRCKGRHASGRCPASASIMGRILEPWVEEQFLAALGPDGPLAEASTDTSAIEEAARAVESADYDLAGYRDDLDIQRTLGMDSFREGLEVRRQAVDGAREKLTTARNHSALANGVADTPGRLLDAWPTLSVPAKRTLLTAAIDCVVVRSVRGSASPVTVDDRTRIYWRGTAPTDLPRRGHRVPLASFPWPDESPTSLRVEVAQDRQPSAVNGRTRSRGKRHVGTSGR